MSTFFALLTVVAQVAAVGALAVWAAARLSPAAAPRRLAASVRESGLALAWVVAVVATLGSLYYSEVANFEPCELCWYQRIGMYPMVVILGVAALRRDGSVARFVLPIVGVGAVIAAYHYVIQRFPDVGSGGCDPSVPCSLTWVWRFHYISIPMMALSGFVLIAVLVGLSRAADRSDARERS